MVGVLAAGTVYLGLIPRTFAQTAQTNRLVEYVSPVSSLSGRDARFFYADQRQGFRIHHRSVVG